MKSDCILVVETYQYWKIWAHKGDGARPPSPAMFFGGYCTAMVSQGVCRGVTILLSRGVKKHQQPLSPPKTLTWPMRLHCYTLESMGVGRWDTWNCKVFTWSEAVIVMAFSWKKTPLQTPCATIAVKCAAKEGRGTGPVWSNLSYWQISPIRIPEMWSFSTKSGHAAA